MYACTSAGVASACHSRPSCVSCLHSLLHPPPPSPQAKQEPNEFIVLNAAAYHAGYNLGFNCAEAINFAMPVRARARAAYDYAAPLGVSSGAVWRRCAVWLA